MPSPADDFVAHHRKGIDVRRFLQRFPKQDLGSDEPRRADNALGFSEFVDVPYDLRQTKIGDQRLAIVDENVESLKIAVENVEPVEVPANGTMC